MIDVLGGISNPLIESAAVAAIGVVALACKWWRTCLVLVAIAIAWAWLCSTPAFAFWLWKGLANQYPPRPIADYPHADAIVLVGGGPLPRDIANWNAADDPAVATPLGVAVALYRAGKAPTLVTTGSYGVAEVVHALTRQGIPSSSIHPFPASATTHEDSQYSTTALRPAAGKTILLVTTAAHMPRTVVTFRKYGFKVIAAAAQPPKWTTQWHSAKWPRRVVIYLSTDSLHEYIGLLYYRLRGWAIW